MPDWLYSINGWFTRDHIDYTVRIIVAIALGGIIGIERERQDKPAGFRTIILICLGACIFTIVSQIGSADRGDPSRVAAQIVTGIGFLGAGAIIHDRGNVVGLTTAASIWSVAAIGMAAGFGELGLATIGTIAILIALELFHSFERLISRSRHVQEYTISGPKVEDSLERLTALVGEAKLHLIRRTWYEEPDRLVYQVRAAGSSRDHDQFRLLITKSDEFQVRKPARR